MNIDENISADCNSAAADSQHSQPENEARHEPASVAETRPLITNHRAPVVPPPVEPWPAPVDGRLLLDELRRTFERFVVLPKAASEALALWTLHTYAFPLREVSAYLGIESPVKRCGKTTLLAVLDKLAHRPVLAANISFKAFFHVIEQAQPTLLIDETDTFLPANDELRGILNAGYHRSTAFVIRFAQSAELAPLEAESPPTGVRSRLKHHAPVRRSFSEGGSRSTLNASRPPSSSALSRFSCWCPKAMAAIGRLPDTLADRCILIRMQRKTAKETCERLRNLQADALGRQCARFVLDHQEAIAAARPQIPPALNDRAADIWEPLFALADLAGGPWPDLARQAAIALSGSARGHDGDGGIEALLDDILICFVHGKSRRMLSRELAQRLNALMTKYARPWRQILQGKEVTELWLAKTLRPYGIYPKCFREGEKLGRGYFGEDFIEVFERYMPDDEPEVPSAGPAAALPQPSPGSGPLPPETPSANPSSCSSL